MANREQIREQMTRDGIKYILTQFVDIHGAAKVKLVPASTFDNVVDDGAGFAGGSLHGMGQGPNAHDMAARIDIDSYTPLPLGPRHRTLRFRSVRRRRASSLLPSAAHEEGARRVAGPGFRI